MFSRSKTRASSFQKSEMVTTNDSSLSFMVNSSKTLLAFFPGLLFSLFMGILHHNFIDFEMQFLFRLFFFIYKGW